MGQLDVSSRRTTVRLHRARQGWGIGVASRTRGYVCRGMYTPRRPDRGPRSPSSTPRRARPGRASRSETGEATGRTQARSDGGVCESTRARRVELGDRRRGGKTPRAARRRTHSPSRTSLLPVFRRVGRCADNNDGNTRVGWVPMLRVENDGVWTTTDESRIICDICHVTKYPFASRKNATRPKRCWRIENLPK